MPDGRIGERNYIETMDKKNKTLTHTIMWLTSEWIYYVKGKEAWEKMNRYCRMALQ